MVRNFVVIAFVALQVGCGAAIDDAQLDAVLALEGDVAAGESFYGGECARCHGPDGNGDGSGPSLQGNDLSDEDIARNILRGPLSMPSYNDEDDQTIANLVAYVGSL